MKPADVKPPNVKPADGKTRWWLLPAAGLLALVCAWPFYVLLSPYWEDPVYEFPGDRSDLRIRVVEADGRVCAELRQEDRHTPDAQKWRVRSRDCAWPEVEGGGGWLAGGQAHEVPDAGTMFYGIVPGATAEVRLTLTGGATLRIPTRPAGKDGLRVYAHQEPKLAGPVTAVQLRNAEGAEIRVF